MKQKPNAVSPPRVRRPNSLKRSTPKASGNLLELNRSAGCLSTRSGHRRNMSMSYHAEAYEDYDRPWFLKKSLWIIAAVILCLLAAGVGIFTYVGLNKIPDVGGGLTIEADPDTRIYIADKLVATTNVTFTWEEL